MRIREFLVGLSPIHSASAAKVATNGGATVTVIGWLTVNEWCGIFGVMIALIGLIGQRLSAREDQKRKDELHKLDMQIRAAELRRLGTRADDVQA